MFGDYGYMEEGQLGKPYNLTLLKRLLPFARPFGRRIAAALLLTLLATVLDLAPPYLSKVAIDRHILASWYRVRLDPDVAHRTGSEVPVGAVERGAGGTLGLVSGRALESVDPRTVHRLRREGVLSRDRFYRVPQERVARPEALAREPGVFPLKGGALAVPLKVLNRLGPEAIGEIRSPDIQGVARIGLIILGILILALGVGYAEQILLEQTGQFIMRDIRLRLFERIQGQAMGFFDRQPVGRLVTRMTNDIENLNELFKSVLVTVFKDVFHLAGILVVLLVLNWKLALICLALLPLIFGLALLFSTMAREAFRELREKVAKLNAFLQERVTGMRVIQVFAREAEQMSAFSAINHENFLAGMRQIRVFAIFMPLMELVASFAVALLLWYGGGQVLREQLSLGSLVAFISYMQMFFKPIRDISEKYNIMQAAMASTERIFEFMDHPDEETPDPAHPAPPKALSGDVAFSGVSFGYSPDRPVLRDLTFRIHPGETVALVGPTGSGKTTLIHLIERLYEAREGEIRIDGLDIREWPRAELRSEIGLVMQDVFLFAGSVYDNVALGREGVGAEDVQRAVREANACGFIQRLSGGLAHEIGEGGATLSAGERQLLSFARALAANPAVLILDEATSSVDPETERLIQDAVKRITRRRTTLVVAHRLSTIRDADRILVMHRGRLREEGTHSELMALGGIYARLNRIWETSNGNGETGPRG